ncbi:MAG TPA: hypothetical protein VG713_07755, partial [Pirellulales bacterium]|nr:hypothetical protein [Pirellulales bacterium]
MASDISRKPTTGESNDRAGDQPASESSPPRSNRPKRDPLAAEQNRRARMAKAAPLIDTGADAKRSKKKPAKVRCEPTTRWQKLCAGVVTWSKSRFGRSTMIATVSHALLIIILGIVSVSARHDSGVISLFASS